MEVELVVSRMDQNCIGSFVLPDKFLYLSILVLLLLCRNMPDLYCRLTVGHSSLVPSL